MDAKKSLFDEELGVPTGIRTPVAAVKGRCPRPLDDGDIGGARRDRTADLYNAIVALSQLSYDPIYTPIIPWFMNAMQPTQGYTLGMA